MEHVRYRMTVRAVTAVVLAVILCALGMTTIAVAAPTCLDRPATIIGTPGDDLLVGTAQPDVIVGLGGSDTIRGLDGDDRICGGDGNDILFGGAGDDDIAGGRGNDRLYGRTGNDGLFGGTGNDISRGGPGDDYILSWWGDDENYGGTGGNTILAGPGNDLLRAGPLGDSLDAGPGNDTVLGGRGGDLVLDGGGADSIRLGRGDDVALAATGHDKVRGGPGNDLLAGMNGDDQLWGGTGNDLLIGGVGNDTLNASTGNDLCDKNGAENPNGCEQTQKLTYRTVTVKTKGTGIDPTGSGFGDPFFDGAQVVVSIYVADFFPGLLEDAMPVGSATLRGGEFTQSVPVADSQIEIFKTFPTWDYASGAVTSNKNGPSTLQATVNCCVDFGPPWWSSAPVEQRSAMSSLERFDLGRPITADMTE